MKIKKVDIEIILSYFIILFYINFEMAIKEISGRDVLSLVSESYPDIIPCT